ncbi:hypothetical protein N7448_010653 [Penicillium atrosanguineum]|uniref:Uncharacterized protein n=1 Tax=Penicillium atrosanguineum TaxID=1132637 RepID=A0A9W9GHI0_9EURO|nr:uncharacterized protein N7443_007876 [Penicillium atrosanguineum]KAJ5118947.1 hypothetical protein N7526_010584 [Penicillium atrosanguineum]KAJ5119984.1 hypothetical protein N7448_010653 [Penicillium atrosanguineum]KAJ5296983.1 hypothetical protein N7443_007876 [Penicillium atrosanguineum]KAJ5299743.1 hypothetical protein N7476_011300 [Penicillium atrosanguineum]
MKVTHCVALLYATIAVGFPVKLLLTGDTPTIVAERSEILRTQRPLAAQESHIHTPRPTFQEYIARLRSGAGAGAGASISDDSKTAEAKTVPSHSDSHYSIYGSWVGKFMSNDKPDDAKSSANTCHSRIITYLKPAELLDFVDNHGPESVALGLFVLVPIAYFILELLELAIKSCTQERYPHRGRDRVRLVGPERQLRAWSHQHREMLVENEKHWWQARRARY